MLVTPIACTVPNRSVELPILNGRLQIRLQPGSLAAVIYDRAEIEEAFTCSYELNPVFAPRLAAAGVRFSGLSEAGEARIAEFPGPAFSLGTAFLPQFAPLAGAPHPLIAAYIEAVREFPRRRQRSR